MRYMMRTTTVAAVTLLATCFLLSPAPARAQDGGEVFSGNFMIGYRSVDVGGRLDKFKEDINLTDGPRLFNLSVDLTPSEGYRKLVDTIRLDITNFGGDPFETMGFSARKSGAYDLQYHHTKSSYFYQDIILPPELASVSLTTGGDFHTFNFDRVRDWADLKISLSSRAKLLFGLNRYTKIGDSTTTLDINRDEFELDKPIDESMNSYNAGLEYAWDKVTLGLDEQVKNYDNVVEIFLPGFSEGENTTNASSLDFFFLNQPYSFNSHQHTARITAHPNKRLIVKAMASLIRLDLDVAATERSQGIGFNGQPATSDLSGSGGKVTRDMDLYNLDFSYVINDRLSLVGGLWDKSLDQNGAFDFGPDVNRGTWSIDTSGAQAGLEVAISSQLTLTAGYRYESRDVNKAHNEGEPGPLEEEKVTTDQNGYFVYLGYRPSKALYVSAEYEDNSYNDPFTLISPTDQQRIRVRAQYRLTNGLSVVGSYLTSSVDNNDSGWSYNNDQTKVSLSYSQKDLSASLGYANVNLDQKIHQLVDFGGTILARDPFYEADSNFFDAHLRYRVEAQWTVGGDALFYDNSGSFGLKRDDYRVFVEYEFLEKYVAHVGYRNVDYNEDAFNFDDYNADIAEVGIGVHW